MTKVTIVIKTKRLPSLTTVGRDGRSLREQTVKIFPGRWVGDRVKKETENVLRSKRDSRIDSVVRARR